jgi:hypothetical protein
MVHESKICVLLAEQFFTAPATAWWMYCSLNKYSTVSKQLSTARETNFLCPRNTGFQLEHSLRINIFKQGPEEFISYVT